MHELLEFPRVVADLGFEYLQLTPHRDVIPSFNHPRAGDDLVAKFRKGCADAGVGIASVLPVRRQPRIQVVGTSSATSL